MPLPEPVLVSLTAEDLQGLCGLLNQIIIAKPRAQSIGAWRPEPDMDKVHIWLDKHRKKAYYATDRSTS